MRQFSTANASHATIIIHTANRHEDLLLHVMIAAAVTINAAYDHRD